MDFTPNPIAFSVLGIGIRWYAILICAGILLASAIGLFRIKRRGISRNDYLDVILYSVPLGIIGARAWYVFFEWSQYHSVFDIINIRAGGLGIHGGMIVSMLTAFIVCRVKHISFLDCMDTAVPCAALAQAIGRWGNFFNQEAYGTVTNLPWAIVVDGNHVHPTFFYESVWCLFLFIFLSIKDRRKTFRGQTLTLYMILYSLERFFVEQLRVDSLLYGPSKLVQALKKAHLDPSQVDGVNHFGPFLIYPFRTAQFVSLCAIALGLLLYLLLMLIKVKPPKKFVPAYDYEPVGEYYEDDYYAEDDYADEAETYAEDYAADGGVEPEEYYGDGIPSEPYDDYANEEPSYPEEKIINEEPLYPEERMEDAEILPAADVPSEPDDMPLRPEEIHAEEELSGSAVEYAEDAPELVWEDSAAPNEDAADAAFEEYSAEEVSEDSVKYDDGADEATPDTDEAIPETEPENSRIPELKRQLARGFAKAALEKENAEPDEERELPDEAAEEESFEAPKNSQDYYAELVFPSHTMERGNGSGDSENAPDFMAIDFSAGSRMDEKPAESTEE